VTISARALAALLLRVSLLSLPPLWAQELEPGAYSPSPIGANIAVLGDSLSAGNIAFDPSLPIANGHANINTAIAGYVRTFAFFDRLASVAVVEPYSHGNFEGIYMGEQVDAHRSAFGDPALRLAVNLLGTPALTPRQFAGYRQDTILGTSLTILAPLGSYNPNQLINVGSNRWSFKPDIGVSQAIGSWTLEATLGAWFFSDNTNYNGGKVRSQEPIVSPQAQLIYTILPRMWVAFGANYYAGGRTTVAGHQNSDLEHDSRAGVTLALPLTGLQSVKIAYSWGARSTIGADFETFSLKYQCVWFNRL
jgi:hypothetical protein